MLKTRLSVIALLLTLSACASSVPVAVLCPPPPPVPEVLKEPVSTEPSLMQRFETSLQKLRQSLSKAAEQQ